MSKKLVQLSNQDARNTNFYFTESFQRKNHTPFSLEMKKIEMTQVFNYGQNISFDIPMNGDLLHRCFFEVEMPNITWDDTLLKKINPTAYDDFVKYKQNLLSNIQTDIDYWNSKYVNLYNYANIQLLIYIEVKKLLKINNFTIEFLQSRIQTLINKYDKLYQYQLLINSTLIDEINIIGYIIGLDINSSQFNTTYPNVNEIVTMIETDITKKYNNINNYIKYYYSNKIYQEKKYKTVNTGEIFYKWVDNLSHYYFNYFEFNLNGYVVDTYTNDFLHIYQKHNGHIDYIENYNSMTGNTSDIYNNPSYPKIIYIPLLFSFCDNDTPSNALPLIGLQNSNLKISSKINDINNLIYLNDWETEYNTNLTIEIPRHEHSVSNNNTIIEKTFGSFSYSSVKLVLPEHIYKYTFTKINKYSLDYNYKGIDSTSILDEYSTTDDDGNQVMGLNEWIYMKNNIKSNTNISEDTKMLIMGYHYFIEYNYLINIIPRPKVALLAEYGFIDNIEKKSFASSNLEYLINTHHEVILDINNISYHDSLSDISGLIKELYYFSRLKLNKNGITRYSKSEQSKFKNYSILSGNILDSIEINIANEHNLIEHNDVKTEYNSILAYLYLNATLPDGVYYKQFSFDPCEFQPTGSTNMSNISGQNISVILDETIYDEYQSNINNPNKLGIEFKIIYTKYNILTIKNGQGELLFYS